jgi:carboxylate-amine ligase
VAELKPVAGRLGCAQELDVISEVLDEGASYERQRALVASGGGLEDVVDALVTEFAEDRFVKPGEAAHART